MWKGASGTVNRVSESRVRKSFHSTTDYHNELSFLWNAGHHVSIVNVLWYDHDLRAIDLEYASNGNLWNRLFNHGPLGVYHSWSLMMQISNAVQFLHSHCILHLDIKPENILCFKNDTVKLCDFAYSKQGFCTDKGDISVSTSTVGTDIYMAPELKEIVGTQKFKYGQCLDIFSFTVTCFIVATGIHPLEEHEYAFNYDRELYWQLLFEQYPHLIKEWTFCRAMERGLESNPVHRHKQISKVMWYW